MTMNSYNFDEEEVCDDEMKSVAYTTASAVIIFVSAIIWLWAA